MFCFLLAVVRRHGRRISFGRELPRGGEPTRHEAAPPWPATTTPDGECSCNMLSEKEPFFPNVHHSSYASLSHFLSCRLDMYFIEFLGLGVKVLLTWQSSALWGYLYRFCCWFFIWQVLVWLEIPYIHNECQILYKSSDCNWDDDDDSEEATEFLIMKGNGIIINVL